MWGTGAADERALHAWVAYCMSMRRRHWETTASDVRGFGSCTLIAGALRGLIGVGPSKCELRIRYALGCKHTDHDGAYRNIPKA